MAGGGPISQLQSQQQTPMGGGSSPLNTGGGMSGGQTQMPNFAAPQQQPMQQQPMQQQPMQQQPMQQKQYGGAQMANPLFDQFARAGRGNEYYQYMQQLEQQRPGSNMFNQPQPMQNPFQPQQPSFLQDPEFQGYQTQANDLQRQMNEYMQKAPMYQQMQDLQNKMGGFQQRYQQQQMQQMQQMQQNPYGFDQRAINADPQGFQQYMQQMQQREQQRPGSTMVGGPQPAQNPFQSRQFQQPSPFRRGQYLQPQGLMGLMGGRGGYFYKNGGKV